ncbi:MAG: hypothetical protein ACOCSE_03485 [Chitinivibrionales bacterium]
MIYLNSLLKHWIFLLNLSDSEVLQSYMDFQNLPLSLPPLLLYAETHFRFFRHFPSLIYRKAPEIVFDAPGRCMTHRKLPVSLIINDIVKFPIEINRVEIAVSHNSGCHKIFSSDDVGRYEIYAERPEQRFFMFEFSADSLPPGSIYLICKAIVSYFRKKFVVVNDNIPFMSHKPLRTVITDTPFPGNRKSEYGDMHIHTSYSRSHVEFGPPISVTGRMAEASGLSFCGITDHSYDIECSMANYLKKDESGNNWERIIRETECSRECLLLPGEEVSALNSRNRSVHIGVCGKGVFIKGNNDGARRFSKQENDYHVGEVADKARSENRIAFGAHPGSVPSLIHRTLLKRGKWRSTDVPETLSVLQIANGSLTSNSFGRALRLWISLLLQKRRISIIAGNDSHGDFSRYRCIKFPFVSTLEMFERFMGNCRTGIYREGILKSRDDVKSHILAGRTFITNGPYIDISKNEIPLVSNCVLDRRPENLRVSALSSKEFGEITRVRVIAGDYREVSEKTLKDIAPKEGCLHYTAGINLPQEFNSGYIRAEVMSSKDSNGPSRHAYTSPVYLRLTPSA